MPKISISRASPHFLTSPKHQWLNKVTIPSQSKRNCHRNLPTTKRRNHFTKKSSRKMAVTNSAMVSEHVWWLSNQLWWSTRRRWWYWPTLADANWSKSWEHETHSDTLRWRVFKLPLNQSKNCHSPSKKRDWEFIPYSVALLLPNLSEIRCSCKGSYRFW